MPNKSPVWCAHPYHDELLTNGKRRSWKTGPKPSHPKGITTLIQPNHFKRTVSGTFDRRSSTTNEWGYSH